MQCYRCREYDHFASECPNTPNDEETDYEDTDPTSLQMISQDYGPIDSELFKLMKGKNDSTPFLPLKSKTGGNVMYMQKKESLCLTERKADHVYKAVEKGNMINTKTMTSEMTQNQDDNPYKRAVLNNVYKIPE